MLVPPAITIAIVIYLVVVFLIPLSISVYREIIKTSKRMDEFIRSLEEDELHK